MEESPITFDNVGEPPDYIAIEDSSSPELDAEIESHVEAVEQRDANRFPDRVEQTRRALGRPRRRDRPQPRRAQQGQCRVQGQRRPAAATAASRTNNPAAATAPSAPALL